ncbi:MAG: hypothetical protein OYH77_07955 [Pseudomonadota bacterium]|nr:hypothetical protein [Pseudomonadota bacterium]
MRFARLQVFACVAFLMGHSTPEHSVAPNGQESHGGDPLALEFLMQADTVLQALSNRSVAVSNISAQDVWRMRRELAHTRVVAVESPLYVNGRSVMVKYTRLDNSKVRHEIVIHRSSLYEWLRSGGEIRHLVLHEMLWMIGKDDTNYRISRRARFATAATTSDVLIRDICKNS